MRKQKFTIEGRLDGVNELISANRKNPHEGAKEKRKQQNICIHAIRASKIRPVLSYPVSICIKWFERNRRRDPDNIAGAKKFIFDALQETKILKNDGFPEIEFLSDDFAIHKKFPRIEVEIIENE